MYRIAILAATTALWTASPAARAESELKPYAVIDVFYQHIDTGERWRNEYGSSGLLGSRFGLSGFTDVGDSARLSFTIEGGFNPAEGTLTRTDAIFNRQAWVGLKDSWGEVRLGRQNSPLFINAGRLDASLGATQSSVINNFAIYTYRTNDTISYFTPVAKGWQASAYVGGGEHGYDSAGKSEQLALTYDQGIWQGVLAGQSIQAPDGSSRVSWYGGGNVRQGAFTYYLALHTARWRQPAVDINAAELSVKYDLSEKDAIGAGFGYLHDRAGSDDAHQLSLLYRHVFNPRFQVYLGANYLTNRSNAVYRLKGAANAGTPVDYPGADPKSLQAGFSLKL